jgi:hypothetical protein
MSSSPSRLGWRCGVALLLVAGPTVTITLLGE